MDKADFMLAQVRLGLVGIKLDVDSIIMHIQYILSIKVAVVLQVRLVESYAT